MILFPNEERVNAFNFLKTKCCVNTYSLPKNQCEMSSNTCSFCGKNFPEELDTSSDNVSRLSSSQESLFEKNTKR